MTTKKHDTFTLQESAFIQVNKTITITREQLERLLYKHLTIPAGAEITIDMDGYNDLRDIVIMWKEVRDIAEGQEAQS